MPKAEIAKHANDVFVTLSSPNEALKSVLEGLEWVETITLRGHMLLVLASKKAFADLSYVGRYLSVRDMLVALGYEVSQQTTEPPLNNLGSIQTVSMLVTTTVIDIGGYRVKRPAIIAALRSVPWISAAEAVSENSLWIEIDHAPLAAKKVAAIIGGELSNYFREHPPRPDQLRE